MKFLRRLMVVLFRFVVQIVDPRKVFAGIPRFFRYALDLRRYLLLPNHEKVSIVDLHPEIHDRVTSTPFDPHYFYQSNWAIRRILESGARRHVDVGSDIAFISHLAAVIPVTFVDIRPLQVRVEGLDSIAGSILDLPFTSGSVESISCLHVIEHIGLGRYGDPLDPEGSRKAARELCRVLAESGELLVSAPIGRSRVCFNAHRVFSPQEVLGLFDCLCCNEFSVVTDQGDLIEYTDAGLHNNAEYACGLFRFRKSRDDASSAGG